MQQKLLCAFLFFLVAQSIFSQQNEITKPGGTTLSGKDIDRKIQHLMETAGVTGLAVGIVNNNETAYVKSYGYRNKAKAELNTVNTSFYAASLSKALFAYIVMQLVDQEKIDLDKPLYQYLPKPLPEYADYKDLSRDDRWKLITARHCLSHTTGFPNWRFLNPTGSGKMQIFFTPGTRYAYSGEGIFLLQFVIEIITHKGLEELAQEQVFKPFDMERTSYVWQSRFESDYASGHSFDEDTFAIRKRTNANAAGSMQTTIVDYTKFIAAVMQGKGISAQSRSVMLSPQIGIFNKQQFPSLNNDTTSENKNINLSYGLGWGLFKTTYGQAFFKEGHSDDGWVHYAIAIPDTGTALVIMSNSMNGESIFKELTEYITGVVIPWKWEGYIPYRPTIKLTEKILGQYTGDYTGNAKVHIFLENGQLKAESSSEGLPKTTLYAGSETVFFMKTAPITLNFIKKPDGSVDKIKVNDEGETYELTKIIAGNETGFTLSKETLEAYKGKYRLKGSNNRVLAIEIKKDQVFLNIPGQGSMQLIFRSDTTFKAKSVIDIKGEFILENGKVIKMVIEQQGKYEWEKID